MLMLVSQASVESRSTSSIDAFSASDVYEARSLGFPSCLGVFIPLYWRMSLIVNISFEGKEKEGHRVPHVTIIPY